MKRKDYELLWTDPVISRPDHLIVQTVLFPPVPITPIVIMDSGGGSNEADLTVQLQEIIDVYVTLVLALKNG